MSHFDELKRKPQSYDIYHALRILEAHYMDSPRLGNAKRSRDDRVRIEQEADLAFPTSSLKTIEEMPEVNGVRVINRVFGLFGSQGPLPLHLTEYARDRMRNNKDRAFYAFVNNLTHRLTGILYKAWRTGQPAVDFDRGRSGRIEKQISALVGLHGPHLAERDKMPDLSAASDDSDDENDDGRAAPAIYDELHNCVGWPPSDHSSSNDHSSSTVFDSTTTNTMRSMCHERNEHSFPSEARVLSEPSLSTVDSPFLAGESGNVDVDDSGALSDDAPDAESPAFGPRQADVRVRPPSRQVSTAAWPSLHPPCTRRPGQ